MDIAEKTAKKYGAMDRKKKAAMAYLSSMGYAGSFEDASQKWLAGQPMDTISIYKPLRKDGSLNYRNMVEAIFDEVDNVDGSRDPKIANAVQKAYRIYRGKTSQPGDDGEDVGYDDD